VKQLLERIRRPISRIELQLEAGEMYVVSHGELLLLNADPGARCFASTAGIGISHVAREITPARLERVEELVSLVREFERLALPMWGDRRIFPLLCLLLTYPEHTDDVLRFREDLSAVPDATWADVQFYVLTGCRRPFGEFVRDRREHKREYYTAAPNQEFLDGAHSLVFGIHRSGTTWLLRLIREISAHARIGNLTLLRSVELGDGSDADDVSRRKSSGFLEELSDISCLNPGEKDIVDELRDDLPRLLQLACPPRCRFAVKSAVNEDVIAQFSAFDNLRYFHIQRDPRNVYLSNKYFFPEHRCELPTMLPRLIETHRRGRDLARELGALSVRYEDLLADPVGEITRIAEHLGLALGREAASAIARRTSFKAMSKGRELGDLKNGDYFRGGSNWERELTPDEVRLVEREWSRALRELGY
jgi:hypothetical protein